MAGLLIPYDEIVHFDVVTHNAKTGAVNDADSDPTFEVFKEDVVGAAASGTMTKRTGKTGNYHGSFHVYGLYGFEVGTFYHVIVTATVAGVTGKTVALLFRVVAQEPAAGKPALDTAGIADAVLTRNMSAVEAAAPEHSLCTVVLATLESSIADSTWTIKRTDGSTTHATKAVTTDPNAEPITGVS